MRRPAVFFDRDNTLIVCDGYLGEPEKVVLIDGAADAVARCRRLGYAVVVFSNQSGVGRGMFTEEAVHAVNGRLDELLAQGNRAAVIDRHEFCPYHPDAIVDRYRQDSPLRKPAPGMIYQAAEKLALDLTRSWVIGDTPRDIEAGRAAGCRTILFQHPGLSASAAQSADSKMLPDHFVQSLQEAVSIIEKMADDPEPVQEEPLPATLPAIDLTKVENLLEQMLSALRKPTEPAPIENFSITKMIAGIIQIVALAILALAYWVQPVHLQNTLVIAVMLQLFTIALLIMDRQD